MLDKWVHVFNEEWFRVPAHSQGPGMVENGCTFLYFLKWKLARKVNGDKDHQLILSDIKIVYIIVQFWITFAGPFSIPTLTDLHVCNLKPKTSWDTILAHFENIIITRVLISIRDCMMESVTIYFPSYDSNEILKSVNMLPSMKEKLLLWTDIHFLFR